VLPFGFYKSTGVRVNASLLVTAANHGVSMHWGETQELGTAMLAPGSGECRNLRSSGSRMIHEMWGSARFSLLGWKVAMWLSFLLVSSSPLLRLNSGEVDTSALRGGRERSSYWWSNKCNQDFWML